AKATMSQIITAPMAMTSTTGLSIRLRRCPSGCGPDGRQVLLADLIGDAATSADLDAVLDRPLTDRAGARLALRARARLSDDVRLRLPHRLGHRGERHDRLVEGDGVLGAEVDLVDRSPDRVMECDSIALGGG